MDVAVRVPPRAGTSGRASPAHGDTCACRACAWELACPCLCTRVALHMPVALLTPAVGGWRACVAPCLCVGGGPSRQLARGSPRQLQWPFQPKEKGPCLTIPLSVVLLGFILYNKHCNNPERSRCGAKHQPSFTLSPWTLLRVPGWDQCSPACPGALHSLQNWDCAWSGHTWGLWGLLSPSKAASPTRTALLQETVSLQQALGTPAPKMGSQV